MLKQYTPPYITILALIALANIIFSSYLIPFLLVGVVFKIFSISIRKGHTYILMLCILTFLIIENTQGLKLFSLTIIALTVKFLIIPRFKHLFASSLMSGFLYIFSFYTLLYLSVQISSSFDLNLLTIFIANFVIDILIVGFML
jgi:hypothetical protein